MPFEAICFRFKTFYIFFGPAKLTLFFDLQKTFRAKHIILNFIIDKKTLNLYFIASPLQNGNKSILPIT